MSTLAVLAAAGALTWLLRASLIVSTPSTSAAERIARALRYAAPAALAVLAVTSLTGAARDTGDAVWRYAIAAAVAAATARPGRNLALPLLAGAATITVLTAL